MKRIPAYKSCRGALVDGGCRSGLPHLPPFHRSRQLIFFRGFEDSSDVLYGFAESSRTNKNIPASPSNSTAPS